MKYNIWVLLGLCATLQANILLESPKLISEKQMQDLVNSWTTCFTWSWRYKSVKLASCSFIYEDKKAGFAIKAMSVPIFWKKYRVLPNVHDFKGFFSFSNYYFATPLEIKKSNPIPIKQADLNAFMAEKRCVFYTGAGLSAAADVPTMDGLMRLLKMDKGEWSFIKEAWKSPRELCEVFESFCKSMINAEPTKAHYALKELAQKNNVAIITENLDLLQHRTGVEPIFAYSDKLRSVTQNEWKQVDVIICIGLSHDDRGLLAWYKQQNPKGKILAIDLKAPCYLSDDDYFCMGDLQRILMKKP